MEEHRLIYPQPDTISNYELAEEKALRTCAAGRSIAIVGEVNQFDNFITDWSSYACACTYNIYRYH